MAKSNPIPVLIQQCRRDIQRLEGEQNRLAVRFGQAFERDKPKLEKELQELAVEIRRKKVSLQSLLSQQQTSLNF